LVNIYKKIFRGIFYILLILVLIFLIWLVIRYLLPRQVDDFSPGIYCEPEIIAKSQILMVIPIFDNHSIAENKTWCENTLKLGKTLGMHGVYHKYNEFLTLRDSEYIQKGMDEFKKCFGYYPRIFEAPQLALSKDNENLLKSMGLKVEGYPFSLTHKVYHCSDTGKYSNKFVDWI
jgi:peptidoglycan/xylan/chitin deacetylase (PgdA/CDA1 family)